MREMRDCTKRLATLVEILREMGRLEIRASISPIDVKPGSDEAKLLIHFTGRDTPLLTAGNGRVLEAIEVLVSEMLGISEGERHSVQFDAGNFLDSQKQKLTQVARSAIGRVRFTGTPHVFPPMGRRDRGLLEQELLTSGLYFETLGQHSTRWVVLFPRNIRAADGTAPIHLPCGE